jgi:hypothetical protein
MPAPNDADILAGLLPLRWGGLDAPPYDLLTFEFSNDLAARRIPYLDGEVHDNTGQAAIPLTARLYFLNTVEGGPGGVRMFPEWWNEWRARLDGEVRDLEHPVLGPLRARVKGGKGELRASVRSGVIVDVTWVTTVEDPANAGVFLDTQADTLTLATEAGKAAASFGVYYPTAPGVNRAKIPTETDLVDDLAGAVRAAFGASFTAIGRINGIIGRVAQMIERAEALTDPQAWIAVELLVQLWASLGDVAARLTKAVRPVVSVITTATTTLDAFATARRNTLSEIMGLNVQALRSPLVPKGTTLFYYP